LDGSGIHRDDRLTGISRPNGANTALNFLAGVNPAELSPNKLMGESVGD